MLLLAAAIAAALVLSALLPLGSRRRVLCPLSASLGLAAGLAWTVVALLT